MARYGYARISTRSQRDDSQLDALRAAGCERIWTDTASGRLARRPEWDNCLDHLRRGDELAVTRLSRMARSVRHLTGTAALLADRGIDLVVLKQGIDTTTPAGRFTFHVLAAMDEMLAGLISEGTREGLESDRARGRGGGCKPKRTARQSEVARGMYSETHATAGESRPSPKSLLPRAQLRSYFRARPASPCWPSSPRRSRPAPRRERRQVLSVSPASNGRRPAAPGQAGAARCRAGRRCHRPMSPAAHNQPAIPP